MTRSGALLSGARLNAAYILTGVILAVTAPALSSAFAQTPVAGFSGIGGANSKKPIDIESDRLEVDDKSHIATFIGNVSATQGDNNLKSPRLEVTYENASQTATSNGAQGPKPVKPVKADNQTDPGDPFSSGQIKFIHANGGKVIFTNKKDQQEATGDDAFYDVKAQKITMTGKEVILTQKKSIVRGNKLLIDLATGQATVLDKRVRAVLESQGGKEMFPGFGGTKKKEESDSPQTPAQSSGWHTQSR